MTINDKTVLVTGASRGIGQALVEEALRRGTARVYAAARQPEHRSFGCRFIALLAVESLESAMHGDCLDGPSHRIRGSET